MGPVTPVSDISTVFPDPGTQRDMGKGPLQVHKAHVDRTSKLPC